MNANGEQLSQLLDHAIHEYTVEITWRQSFAFVSLVPGQPTCLICDQLFVQENSIESISRNFQLGVRQSNQTEKVILPIVPTVAHGLR